MDDKTLRTYRTIYAWAEQSQRPGGEFDWFAIDKDNHIAAFATAGFGPVPESFFDQGMGSYIRLVELLEDELVHVRSIHSGGFEPYTERGFFAYDFKTNGSGQYEIVSVPPTPLSLVDVCSWGLIAKCL